MGDPRENTKAGALEVLDEKLGAGEDELKLATSLLEHYEQEKLFEDGRAEALYNCCELKDQCWPPGLDKLCPERATVSIPWIGPGYCSSDPRLCAVGTNANRWGGLTATWWLTKSDIEKRRGNDWYAGVETDTQEPLYSRAARVFRLLLDDPASFDPDASVVGPDAAALWERIAYLQAVKCSPDDGRTGSPTGTMKQNCPPRYLREELGILDPARLLVLGKGVWAPVARALEMPAPQGSLAAVRSARLTDGRQIEVFFILHPSDPRGRFFPSLRALAELTT